MDIFEEEPQGPRVLDADPPFMVQCTRCKEVAGFDDVHDLNMAMAFFYMLPPNIVMCPACAEIVVQVRKQHLTAARQAAVDEINAHHKAKQKPSATVVSLKDMELPKQ